MTHINLIHQEVGEIIQIIQYIEWNLCLELEIDGLSEITLGQIKTRVVEESVFDEAQANELIDILKKRNDLIHKYFKRLDFEKNTDNTRFLKNQIGYLKNFKNQIIEFNTLLVK